MFFCINLFMVKKKQHRYSVFAKIGSGNFMVLVGMVTLKAY